MAAMRGVHAFDRVDGTQQAFRFSSEHIEQFFPKDDKFVGNFGLGCGL